MNCFDWQNRASDYLDGLLIGPPKAEADEHLKSCRSCSERHKRFRIIVSSIASQPRSALPIPIRKAPFDARLPRLEMGRLGRTRWEQVPWYLRTTIEGVGIVLMILLGISTGPKLRQIYEKSVEANLEEFTESFREWRDWLQARDRAAPEAPLARGKVPALAQSAPSQEEFSSGDGETEGQGAESDDAGDDSTVVEGGGGANDMTEVRAGHGEIWRFMIRTDSPHEMRPRIVKLLTDLHIPAETPGLGGIEAPGGIQFDLLVPRETMPDIKKQLQALAPKAPAELAETPAGETFSWYKNKSKSKVPEGKTKVVIWLSQM